MCRLAPNDGLLPNSNRRDPSGFAKIPANLRWGGFVASSDCSEHGKGGNNSCICSPSEPLSFPLQGD